MERQQTAGTLLRQARTRAGLSQAELASRTGTSQSVISVYESGRRQPSVPTLTALVEATGSALQVSLGTPNAGPAHLADRVQAHASEIHAAAAAYGVRVHGFFGSAARGDDRDGSDIDLLVDVPVGVGLFDLGRLATQLRDLLRAEVDLVPRSGLKPRVRDRILADLRPI